MKILRAVTITGLFASATGLSAAPYLQYGLSYQNSQNVYAVGDSASVKGRYLSNFLGVGYAHDSWSIQASIPYVFRESSSEFHYQGISQTVFSTTSTNGLGDPTFSGGQEIFGGNRYVPAVSLTAALSAPLGNNQLGLSAWLARPGIYMEQYFDRWCLGWALYAGIPFAAHGSALDKYQSYMGAVIHLSYPVLRSLSVGVDSSFLSSDLVRSDGSLRLGAFFSVSNLLPATNLYFGGQSEVYRSDRDWYILWTIRYTLFD
jgi:hypothetical protein